MLASGMFLACSGKVRYNVDANPEPKAKAGDMAVMLLLPLFAFTAASTAAAITTEPGALSFHTTVKHCFKSSPFRYY